MSRSQDAAKAREIIRRRQRQEEEASRVPDPSTSATLGARHAMAANTRHPAQGSQLPVRITISEKRGNNHSDSVPHIYSVPTTDTYGDESSLMLRPYAVPTPTRYTRPDFLQLSAPSTKLRVDPATSSSAAASAHASFSIPRGASHSTQQTTTAPVRLFRTTNHTRRKKRGEFQHNDDFATVGVQTVNVAQRSAFERRPPLALELWQRIAEQGAPNRRTNRTKRMSPSYQHLQLLHTMQSMNAIRQVQFSPSTCLAADLFVDWWQSNDSIMPSSKRGPQRDGRYRSIDPVKATVAVLPRHAPILSNKKPRLPRRSDVGFPNASEDEIRVKQKEIANETEWEEASPRLVVLVTSDDLGRAVEDGDTSHSAAGDKDDGTFNARIISDEHLQFNGGGLDSMPFAGRELIQAKERNARHFGQPGSSAQLAKFLAPNPYSMLAPPLDATYSPSQGWRPRPFHDRPAGMRYCLASPLSVKFTAGDVEPLICTLALYSLPVGADAQSSGKPSQQAFGKMSEEFVFPAGDWNGKVQLDSIDPSLIDSWMNRKTKAIFSYDPLALSGGPDSLYVVLQVYRLHHDSGCAMYQRGSSPRLQRTQQAYEEECAATKKKSNRVFQQFGTQITSPLCFGLAQVFLDGSGGVDGDRITWPNGESRRMKLYCYPAIPESQDSFVARLVDLAVQEHYQNPSDGQNAVDDGKSAVSETMTSAVSSVSDSVRRKRGVGRLFKISAKQTRQVSALDQEEDTVLWLEGECHLFVSSLRSDFLQAMLASPAELEADRTADNRLPRLLVDASGDLAVLLDPSSQSQLTDDSQLRKRSNLLRLPFSGEPAGYTSTSEFREVYFLPARPEKHYDVDTGLSYRSLLNLLYLYPRLLRLTSSDSGSFDKLQFIIRVQVLQTHSNVEEDSGQVNSTSTVLSAFHNPTPWSGPSLLDQVYTKVFGSSMNEASGTVDLNAGVAIRDEIKLRLPLVLDGSYSMRFELYSVSCASDLSLQLVADAVIPLSSSLSRDAGRVATIIPNGNHRLKLGAFQLQLETRLVSAIHIGDPSVATVLRDFPYANGIKEHSSMTNSGAPSGPLGADVIEEFDASFTSMLGEASPGAVACHFEVLLYIHLCNLVAHQDRKGMASEKVSGFMMGNMFSLFEVIRKVKGRFLASHAKARRHELLKAFIKRYVDLFDEHYLSLSTTLTPDGVEGDTTSEALLIDPSASQDEMFVNEQEETKHEGAIRIRRVTAKSRNSRNGLSPRSPFSRVAYGASKIDRMRIEAELHNQGGLFSQFFDDDETVATAPTLLTSAIDSRGAVLDLEHQHPLSRSQGQGSGDVSSDNSIVRSASASSQAQETGGHRYSGSAEFAQRVRTVAQVMLAPCGVGPSLSNILAKSNSPKATASDDMNGDGIASHASQGAPLDDTFRFLPDSDEDEDEESTRHGSFDSIVANSVGAALGPKHDGPIFVFSIRSKTGSEIPVSFGKYIYESIMLLWLSTWLDHVESSLIEPSENSGPGLRHFATFPLPEYQATSVSQRPIFSYYAHMDVLLPLCLKSMVLRYSTEVLPMYPTSTKVRVDESHMAVLEPFTEMLARGLLGQALSGLGSPETRDKALARALSSSEIVLDFFVGLLSVIHPEHMSVLLRKFFRTLRDCETEHLVGDTVTDVAFEWSEESLHRVRSSRQIRLRTVEVLAVLPSFLAINYLPRFTSQIKPSKPKRATWTQQYSEVSEEPTKKAERQPIYADGAERLPTNGWLSDLILSESLSICSLSCEAFVAESIAHGMETAANANPKNVSILAPTLKKRPGASLTGGDLLMFESLAIHAITCVYELILRRHAMDRRYQTDSCRERIAGLFAVPILDKSLSSSRWLARIRSTDKVRSIWLLCFVFILQEAPVSMIRDYVRSLCNPADLKIHRFIRLLRLSSSTFQSFVDLPRHANFPSQIDKGLSPWLLQESFNTIVAATIIVVEECAHLTSSFPQEQEKLMGGILDLLLHLLTTPQSSVTHLRAVGGALQALEQFGVELFLDITGSNLQHWIRVILSLMNSTSLSVRSIAVDFVVSLLGSAFDACGDICFISTIFATVLPEVAAREIALYSVSGLLATADDMARSLWPLRRSIADLEDTNPLDDDRVDPQLAPLLSVFCRACQAIIDGLLIEIRLRKDSLSVVGSKILYSIDFDSTFDADEESIFEAATFFDAETSPMQRLRWLLTLKSLHEAKGHWVEAAETLSLCSRTITEAVPHLRHVWRPSQFVLWSDSRRSLWLNTVGEELGHPDRGNAQVMEFAEEFLEPSEILGTAWKATSTGKLRQPNIQIMSLLLGQISKDAARFYLLENGKDELAHIRLESMLRATMDTLESHGAQAPVRMGSKAMGAMARKRQMEDEASLRRVLASISGDVTKLAEKRLETVQNETNAGAANYNPANNGPSSRYLALCLTGKRPPRFQESTSLPTFLEFGTPCICRLPAKLLQPQGQDRPVSPKEMCLQFARPLMIALQKDCGANAVKLVTEPSSVVQDENVTYLHVYPTDPVATSSAVNTRSGAALFSKSFFYRKAGDMGSSEPSTVVEMKVAREFPGPLSRQRAVVTTEIGFVTNG